jgi:molybdopterin-guanine dinucleotide biosynthesis protein A
VKPINCILLAGGQSTRMGVDKALLSFGTSSVLQYMVNNIKEMEIISEILICSNNSSHFVEGTNRLDDAINNCGPIGGIYAGLSQSSTDYNWVVSCDAPFIHSSILVDLMQHITSEQAVIPIYKGKEMFTLGVYHITLIPVIEQCIREKNYKLKNVLDQSKTNYIDLSHYDEKIFANMNTFEHYQKALKQLNK